MSYDDERRKKELEKISFEPPINWHIDQAGREAQIEREINALTVRARRFKSEVDDRMKEVIAVEDENRDQVRDQSHLAYAALGRVVETLLRIGDGSRRLSREDPAIIAVLEEAAGHFHALSEISRENASQMGTAASHYMSLGDQAAVFVDDLQSYVDSLNNDVPYIWDVMKSHKTTLEEKQVRRAELQNQYDSAADSRADFGNNFLGFFDSGVLDRLDDKMKEAEQRLDTNKDEQQRAQEQMDECYKLALRHRNAGSAVLELKKSVQIAAAAFDVEYNKVTDAQTVENGLWDGLLGLKNYINQTDYRTTRDNSLRVILKLLDMDDEVFRGQQLYEDAEEAIKLAIKAKMGDDAVAKLSRETPGITDEQFQY